MLACAEMVVARNWDASTYEATDSFEGEILQPLPIIWINETIVLLFSALLDPSPKRICI